MRPSLKEAPADQTRVVMLVVDNWFVDNGFGFGKVPAGEMVFIHASVVHGGEVLMIGTDAWVQVVNDEARGKSSTKRLGTRSLEGGEGQLAARSREKVEVVCNKPPGLRDEPAEHIAAPTWEQVAHTLRPK